MTQAFDPYQEWLDIPPEEQPPDHYRLLGLERFEDRLDVIQKASLARQKYVDQFQFGSHADESQKLLTKIASARACLQNPGKKSFYDRALRAKLAPTKKESPHVTPPPLVASQVEDLPRPEDSRKSSQWIVVSIVAGGLVAVGLLLLLLIPLFSDREETAVGLKVKKVSDEQTTVLPPIEDTSPTQEASPIKVTITIEPDTEAIEQDDDGIFAEDVDRGSSNLLPEDPKAPSNETRPFEPAVSRTHEKMDYFTDLSEEIDLPEYNQTKESVDMELGTIRTNSNEPWQLSLIGGDSVFRSPSRLNRKFILETKDPNPAAAKWVIHFEEAFGESAPKKTFVAGFWREDNTLKFRWSNGVDEIVAEHLRNCVLQVGIPSAGKSHSMALREPVQIEAPRIDLLQRASKFDIPIRWFPNDDNIIVQVTQIEGFDRCKIDPLEGPLKQPISLKFIHVDDNLNESAWIEFRMTFSKKSSGLSATLTSVSDRNIESLFKQCEKETVRRVRRNRILAEMASIQKRLSGKDPKKRPSLQEAASMKNQLLILDMEKFFLDSFEKIHQKARVHFQIETLIKSHDLPIVLARTTPPEPTSSELQRLSLGE